jgi:hypothetical protein
MQMFRLANTAAPPGANEILREKLEIHGETRDCPQKFTALETSCNFLASERLTISANTSRHHQ